MISPRLQYACKLLFQTILGIPFNITSRKDEFLGYAGAKLSYGDIETDDIAIKPHTILFEQGIKTYDTSEEIMFDDPLALAFYISSRYEEYLPFEPDEHGRFEANNSILFSKGLLTEPHVHVLAEGLFNRLKQRYPLLKPNFKQYAPEILIDIDQAYSYKGKGLAWSLYISFKNLLSGNFRKIPEQWKVLSGQLADPYDSFYFLEKKQKESGIEFLYFIHCGDWGKFDRSIPVNFKEIRNLISRISGFAKTGIHPSYYSIRNKKILQKEIVRLKEITGKEVAMSRQHYLRLFMPVSYHMLLDEGIFSDYSMGYAKEEGYRSGMCIPYNWYDLEKETETSLVIHPVSFMEGIFGEEKNLDPESSWKHIERLIETVERHHGKFIAAWHNHTLTDQGNWKGWKSVFEKMLDKLTAV